MHTLYDITGLCLLSQYGDGIVCDDQSVQSIDLHLSVMEMEAVKSVTYAVPWPATSQQ